MSKQSSLKKALAISLAVALLLSGCSAGQAVQTDAEPTLGTAVEVQQLKRSTIKNELTYIGQVQPEQSVAVASKLSAEVLSVNFEVGDYVNAGDVLFTVDAKDINDQIRTLQASAAQTEFAIKQAEYGLEIAKEGSVQEELGGYQYKTGINTARGASQSAHDAKDNIKDAKDRYEDAADAAYANWQSQIAKYNQLVDSGASATDLADQQRQVDAARNDYSAANMAVENYDDSYDSAKNSVNQADRALNLAYDSYDTYQELVEESRERAVQQAEFGVEGALISQNITEVQLSIARSNLGNAVVTSPISGIISSRNIEAGQMISPSVLPYTIVKMDKVHVQVSVSETLINNIQVGDEVQVVIQAISEDPLTGVVTVVSPVAGSNSTYPIQVELDNSTGLIKPGMFSQVSFIESQKDETFAVNKNVVMRDETTQYVYIIENGTAKRVNVTTGLSNGEEIEILSGVKAGDQIVVVGQEYLDNDMPVNIVKKDGVDMRSEQNSALSAADEPDDDEEDDAA